MVEGLHPAGFGSRQWHIKGWVSKGRQLLWKPKLHEVETPSCLQHLSSWEEPCRHHGSAASSGEEQGGSWTGPNHLTPGTSTCPSPHAATVVALGKGTNVLIDLPKAKLEVGCRAENWTKLKLQAMNFSAFPMQIQRWCLCVIHQLIGYDAWLLQQVWWLQLVTLTYPEVLSAL